MSDLARRLADFDRRLDPARPERGGAEIIGYGEVSAVLRLAELPDRVLKRMSGFPDAAAVRRYCAVVERYLAILQELGVAVVPTELVPVEPSPGRYVVYLVQPRLDPARLGQTLLRQGTTQELEGLLAPVLERIHRVLAANPGRKDGREVGLDPQLSNWHWTDAGGSELEVVLLDVGTPFMRRHGSLELDPEVFLAAFPRPLRWGLRRLGVIERYIADYFHFDRTVIDLLGNFEKEGVPEKIPAAVAFVNAWIARRSDAALLGPIDEAAVRAYYARDARELELFLAARRATRFLRTRLLGRRYDFILPGPIER